MWGRAGAPPRGSRSPETQIQLRKDRSGARGSGPGLGGSPLPLRAARPQAAGCSPRCAGPGRSVPGANRAGLVGAGDRGLHTPQRPARGSLTRDSPHPPGRPGTACGERPAPDPSRPSSPPVAGAPPRALNFKTPRTL